MKNWEIAEAQTSQLVTERNAECVKAYKFMVEVLRRCGLWSEHEEIRTAVVRDLRHHPNIAATMDEYVTPFAVVSLGANDKGELSIGLSLDSRAEAMISTLFRDTILRRAFWATSSIASCLKIGTLGGEVLETFRALRELGETEYQKILVSEPPLEN